MTTYFKYPRTPHLPFSLGVTSDDKMLHSVSHFVGKQVVVTEKMDGENTSIYSDYYHARSIDGRHHPSRDWVKQFVGSINHNIPEGWRVCGENMYARHSIAYDDLPSYFLGFSVWNRENACLSWDETVEWLDLIGITSVPVLYRGVFDEKIIRTLWDDTMHDTREGYVVRLSDQINYENFGKSFGKFVRPNHVTTDIHWMHQEIKKNQLAQR
jgi:hypothetical protein